MLIFLLIHYNYVNFSWLLQIELYTIIWTQYNNYLIKIHIIFQCSVDSCKPHSHMPVSIISSHPTVIMLVGGFMHVIFNEFR